MKMIPVVKPDIVIGRRVIGAGGRYGIVTAIHGVSDRNSCRSIFNGAGAMGGTADFDVIFSDGTQAIKVPECLMYNSVAWQVLDEVVPADFVADAIEAAKKYQAERAEQARIKAEKFAAGLIAVKAEYPYLHTTEAKKDFSPGRLAATNMRIELKRHFPNVKFSVKSDFNSVRIGWTNGPTDEMVRKIVGKYEAGHFDGMTDSYDYRNTPFNQTFGDPKYVFVERSNTIDEVRKAWSAKYGGDTAKDIPENWESTSGYDQRRRIHEAFSEYNCQ